MEKGRTKTGFFRTITFLLFLVFLLLCGCQRGNGGEDASSEAKENTYTIYYLNTNMTKMSEVSYEALGEDLSSLVWELYDQLLNVPTDVDVKSPLPARSELQRIQWESNVLYLYFDINYTMGNSHPLS